MQDEYIVLEEHLVRDIAQYLYFSDTQQLIQGFQSPIERPQIIL